MQWVLMKCRLDAAVLLVLRAAFAKGQTEKNGGRFSTEASVAKLFASEAAMYITHQAVQIHGGMRTYCDVRHGRRMRNPLPRCSMARQAADVRRNADAHPTHRQRGICVDDTLDGDRETGALAA